jgi:hypothetical protein
MERDGCSPEDFIAAAAVDEVGVPLTLAKVIA